MKSVAMQKWMVCLAVALLAGCGTHSSPEPGPDGGSDSNDGENQTDTRPSSAWGWISVLEENDNEDWGWSMITEWIGGVRAYFAESQSYHRALPHHLGFLKLIDSQGSCQLFANPVGEELLEATGDCFMAYDGEFECWRECGEDQQSARDDEQEMCVCQILPPHWNPGKITIQGLSEAVSVLPDTLDRYLAKDLPEDLFGKGDEITVTAEGGQLDGFTLHVKGVSHLEPDSGTVFVLTLTKGSPATISWKPADPDSRIQVVLTAGAHDPNPLMAALICDAPDADAKIEIPARLVDNYIDHACIVAKGNRITRYNRTVKTIEGLEVELFAGSSRAIGLYGNW